MRLLIVDDDFQIREGMKYGIEWEEIGVTEVDTCANGFEAVASVKNKAPDILVADIQMPGMTGLEMVGQVLAIDSKIRIIFISAYSEFAYCRQALLLGAKDYVTKPIQMDEFLQVIRRNVEAAGAEKLQTSRYKGAVLRQQTEEIFRQGNLLNLDLFYQNIREQFPYIGRDSYLLLFIRIDEAETEEHFRKEAEDTLRLHMDGRMALLGAAEGGLLGMAAGNRSALATVYIQASLGKRFQEWNHIYAEKYGTISAGISQSFGKTQILEGFRQAKEAAGRLFYEEKGGFLPYREEHIREGLSGKDLKWLDKKKSDQDFLEKLEAWAGEICLRPSVFKEYLLQYYWDAGTKTGSGEEGPRLRKQIEESNYAKDCVRLLKHALDGTGWEEGRYSHMVALALAYIQKHYAEQLTLGEVAGAVGKSPNYFSGIFKKETGRSFPKYLNEQRLKRAYWLLLHTNKQVRQICEEAGYTDYVYFSQLFRKEFGCSASEVRGKEKR